MALLSQTEPGRLEQFGQFLQGYWPILAPVVLGAAGIYFLLPQPGRSRPLWGALAGGLALLAAGILVVRADMVLPETILFYAFSGIAIAGGCLLITQKNPVHAALSFALVILSTCGLFLLQGAPFLMAATIIVYAGAIIVTFLFVIMLAQQAGLSSADQRSREPFLATLAGFVLLGALLVVLQRTYDTSRLDPILEKLGRASRAASVEEVRHILGDFKKFITEEVSQVVADPKDFDSKDVLVKARQELWNALTNVELFWRKPDRLKTELTRAHRAGLQIRYTQGTPLPPADLPLAKNSGTPANAPLPDFSRKNTERLPAQNVAGLGRTLFTEYLLPVELAGILLLVASIGAIAIAGRRAEGLR